MALSILTNAECCCEDGGSNPYIDDAVEEEEYAGGVAVLTGRGEEEHIVVLDEHVGDAGVIVDDGGEHLRVALITQGKKLIEKPGICTDLGEMEGALHYLLVEELGEEALGLERGDVAAVVAPDEDAALDVQQEQRRHRARHRRGVYMIPPRRIWIYPPIALPATAGGHPAVMRAGGRRILLGFSPAESRRAAVPCSRSAAVRVFGWIGDGTRGAGRSGVETVRRGRIRGGFLSCPTVRWVPGMSLWVLGLDCQKLIILRRRD